MLKIIWRKAKGFFAYQKKIHKIVTEFQKIELQMKKLFAPVALMATLLVVSCGPSAEEKAAAEKARQDSIAAVEQARQDSIKAVEEATKLQAIQDSLAKVAADSIAAAEEAAAKKSKGGSKPKPTPKKEEPKKETPNPRKDATKDGQSTNTQQGSNPRKGAVKQQ
jgi:hypothetical protein